MYLETERLLITDIEPSDGAAIVEMASDGSLEQDIGFDAGCGSWMDDWIKWNAEQCKTDDPWHCESLGYIIRLKDGTPVGSIGCTMYEDSGKIGTVWFIGAKYRGHGYAAEAAKAYSEYFLEHYDADELTVNVREANIPSWKTAEKAGFRLVERKMYKDTGDEAEEMYRFYTCEAK